jgi:hypothetical protein
MTIWNGWTGEAIETFARMNGAGCSATEIAKKLGCTKNAIMGRRFRSKTPARAPQQRHAPKVWPTDARETLIEMFKGGVSLDAIAAHFHVDRGVIARQVKRLKLSRVRTRTSGPRTNIVSGFIASTQPKPPSDHTLREDTPLTCEPVDLLALKPHSCKWPVSGEGADTLFCSAPSPDAVYCQRHAKRAYQKTPPMARPEHVDPSVRRAA